MTGDAAALNGGLGGTDSWRRRSGGRGRANTSNRSFMCASLKSTRSFMWRANVVHNDVILICSLCLARSLLVKICYSLLVILLIPLSPFLFARHCAHSSLLFSLIGFHCCSLCSFLFVMVVHIMFVLCSFFVVRSSLGVRFCSFFIARYALLFLAEQP